MFVGHYSASLVAKAINPKLPLGPLFIAAQLVDIAWAVFVMAGVEKTELVSGFTKTNDFDLVYVPYTHGLTATLGWALLAFLGWRFLVKKGKVVGSALALALVVLSHWFLDLLVHTPDLPLYGTQAKQGFGLWNYPYINLGFEALLFFGALIFYYRATKPLKSEGRWQILVLGVGMFAIQISALVGPRPDSMSEMAMGALGSYLLFAAFAQWFDSKRVAK